MERPFWFPQACACVCVAAAAAATFRLCVFMSMKPNKINKILIPNFVGCRLPLFCRYLINLRLDCHSMLLFIGAQKEEEEIQKRPSSTEGTCCIIATEKQSTQQFHSAEAASNENKYESFASTPPSPYTAPGSGRSFRRLALVSRSTHNCLHKSFSLLALPHHALPPR